ncbi:ribosomal-processing cysteine protease Prp [bacterium]|nr:ribosomal-processing cysteine protease Prp [bacterium]
MINVKLSKDFDTFHIDFSGHAGYSKKGTDMVCAAVSATVFNFLIYVDHIKDIKFLKKEIIPEKPRCYAIFKITKEIEQFNIIYDYFVFSMNLLKKNNPDHITLNIIDKNPIDL